MALARESLVVTTSSIELRTMCGECYSLQDRIRISMHMVVATGEYVACYRVLIGDRVWIDIVLSMFRC
jgi:hypothetical protein